MRKAIHEVESFYDYLKHITSLSIGSVVVLATFSKNFVQDSEKSIFFKVALGGLITSVIASALSMLFTLSIRRYENVEPPNWEENAIVTSYLISITGLVLGVISLALFIFD